MNVFPEEELIHKCCHLLYQNSKHIRCPFLRYILCNFKLWKRWSFHSNWMLPQFVCTINRNQNNVLAFPVWMVWTSTCNMYQWGGESRLSSHTETWFVWDVRGEKWWWWWSNRQGAQRMIRWRVGRLSCWMAKLSEAAEILTVWMYFIPYTRFLKKSFQTSVWVFGSMLTADETTYFDLATPSLFLCSDTVSLHAALQTPCCRVQGVYPLLLKPELGISQSWSDDRADKYPRELIA